MPCPLQLPIRDPLCAAACIVYGADNAARDPYNSFCISYLVRHQKTVFVLRNLPQPARAFFAKR